MKGITETNIALSGVAILLGCAMLTINILTLLKKR